MCASRIAYKYNCLFFVLINKEQTLCSDNLLQISYVLLAPSHIKKIFYFFDLNNKTIKATKN